MLRLIYQGKFEEMKEYQSINTFTLSLAMNQFMRIQAQKCGTKGIPKNDLAVIYDYYCSEQKVTKEGAYEISRVCSDWTPVPSGLYTSKANTSAFKKLETKLIRNSFDIIVPLLADRNKAYAISEMSKEIIRNFHKMFRLNSCGSKAIKRFEENLQRYINGQEPLKLK